MYCWRNNNSIATICLLIWIICMLSPRWMISCHRRTGHPGINQPKARWRIPQRTELQTCLNSGGVTVAVAACNLHVKSRLPVAFLSSHVYSSSGATRYNRNKLIPIDGIITPNSIPFIFEKSTNSLLDLRNGNSFKQWATAPNGSDGEIPHTEDQTSTSRSEYCNNAEHNTPSDNNSGQIPANLTDEDIINMRVALAQENTMGIDFVKTIEMLQTSPHCTVSPKTIAYNAVLSAAERNSNAQLALAVLDDMRKKENVVDAVSCRIALVTCAKCGYTNEALELYDEMVRNKYPIDHGVMRSIMATLANDGRAIECLNIFNDMKNLDKIAQNDETFVRLDDYLKVIEACTKGYMYEDGLQKYRELKKTKLYRLTPELIDKVLHLCSAMDNYTDAMDIYGDMLKEDGPLSTYQCKLLMTIFYMARKHTPVESVYNYMRQRGIPVDSGNYQIVLETYARTGQYQKALDIIKVMESEGLLKNTYVPFIAAAESCRQSGEWKLAIQLLRRANEHNAHKSIDMYNVVLAVCATAEEWDTIISLYAEITNVIDKEKEAPTGFSMNGDTIAHILMAYFYTDDLEQVKKLLKLPVVDTPLLLKLRRNIETRHTEASTKEG